MSKSIPMVKRKANPISAIGITAENLHSGDLLFKPNPVDIEPDTHRKEHHLYSLWPAMIKCTCGWTLKTTDSEVARKKHKEHRADASINKSTDSD